MTQRALIALTLSALLSSALAQNASLVEDGRSLKLDCKGGSVRVDGNRNTLTLTGSCSALTVDGNDNKIRVALVGSIVLNGNGNTLTWTRAAKGARPGVSNTGSRNSIVHK